MEIDGGDAPVPNEVREYTSARPNLIKFLMGLWVMDFIGFHWILNWWRRGELNPRPKGVNRRRLHVYSLI